MHAFTQAKLKSVLDCIPHFPYPSQSRAHPLRSMQHASYTCFVKRDDELGVNGMGSKIRKYRTLIPALLAEKIQEVVVIGSAYSNNVLNITPLLIENGISPTLFLKELPEYELKGNLLFTKIFVPDASIHWIPKTKWGQVEQLAQAYAKSQISKVFVLKEGASIAESLPGALTLPIDLIRNEQELGLKFDHLFIEAGTGMMAIALILGWHWMQKEGHIHVLLLADEEANFLKQLQEFYQVFENLIGDSLSFPSNFSIYRPRKGQSFGSIRPSLFQNIKDLARQEGILTDPIYTAKLFEETRQILAQNSIRGNILIHHSGGSWTLSGFQERIKPILL